MDLMYSAGNGGDVNQHPQVAGQNQSRMGGRIGARMDGLNSNNDGRPIINLNFVNILLLNLHRKGIDIDSTQSQQPIREQKCQRT